MNVAKEETKGSLVQPETQDFEGCRARLVATANQDFQVSKALDMYYVISESTYT